MKKWIWAFFSALCCQLVFAQPPAKKSSTAHTLLWRVSGKNLTKPTYIFGTMHLLCASDIVLSDSLKKAISGADDVYLELDLDNFMEIMGAMTKMRMRGDTTLADLLSPEDYQRLKKHYNQKSSLLPFAFVEKCKPLVTSSLLMEQQTNTCGQVISMEQMIQSEAGRNRVEIKGLESIAYQMSIFDSIPYKLQAEQLMQLLDTAKSEDANHMQTLTALYKSQDLDKLEAATAGDKLVGGYADLLLYNRNRNWVQKLATLMPGKKLVVGVGAGHLPGEKGVLNLLRQAGYKVEPVQNEMIKKPKVQQG